MRSMILAAVAALAFVSAASAYTLDAKGKCHGADGKFVATAMCKVAPHCTTGKACGNTCIAKDKVCHK